MVLGDPRLLDAARRRIDQLESRWSRFLSGSEVSALNAAGGRPIRVSQDTYRLVSASVQAWADTAGRFDPTVLGDVIRAGYDRTIQEVIQGGRAGVSVLQKNAAGIRLDPTTRTVSFPADTGFDPGGLGKGLAADIVVDELIGLGARGACVNLGGDLRVQGDGPDDGRWVISIDHPTRSHEICLIAIADGGVATSTTAKRVWSVDGERRNHIIDPETGRFLSSAVIAATSIASDAASAEVAAKHALLSGPASAIAAIEGFGCDGLIVTDEDTVIRTRGFDRFAIQARTDQGR